MLNLILATALTSAGAACPQQVVDRLDDLYRWHLAAQADQHLKVVKSGDPVSTSIMTLSDDARVEEIARMTGGSAMTDASRALAAELLNERLKRQPAGG